MLVKSTGTFEARSVRASRRPVSSPGSITAASNAASSAPSSAPSCVTASCPSRRTTSSSRALISSCGSQMRTRATGAESPIGAGIARLGWYEAGVNERPRILVVDDDEDIRMLLRELLERAGFTIDEAGDGRTALRNLFDVPPALVILDVSMPDLDGYQTLARIR